MGRFWKRGSGGGSPDEVRDAIIRTVAAGLEAKFRRLCDNNRELILANFESWTTVPEPLRQDEAKLDDYVQAMGAVAQFFADNGHPELMRSLQGGEGENPLEQWEAEMAAIDAIIAAGEYVEAGQRLNALAIEIGRCRGNAVDMFMPLVVGRQGEVLFRLKQFDQACERSLAALRLCMKCGDISGLISYAGNLGRIRLEQGREEEGLRWITGATNFMIQVGQVEEAKRLRTEYGIRPLDSHIDVELDI
jgi:hypothetical protein